MQEYKKLIKIIPVSKVISFQSFFYVHVHAGFTFSWYIQWIKRGHKFIAAPSTKR